MCVVVQIVTIFYFDIFSVAGDKMIKKCLCKFNCMSMQKCMVACETFWYVLVQVVTGAFYTIFHGAVYSLALFEYTKRQAGMKMSLYVELYEYVKVYGGNAQAFIIDLIVYIHMSAIQEHGELSCGFD